ncbi:MAG: hypothetical protein Q4A00_05600 [Flavobacteriaceae bacterium]|nr:hypothetical protein [Flavobacteriaceae bacterium]
MEQVFKDNPKLDIAYKTADGKYFFLESDAINHANTLEEKRVKKVTPENTGDVKEAIQEVVNENLTLVNDLQENLETDQQNEVSNKEKKEVSEVESTEEPNEPTDESDEVETTEGPAIKPNKKN